MRWSLPLLAILALLYATVNGIGLTHDSASFSERPTHGTVDPLYLVASRLPGTAGAGGIPGCEHAGRRAVAQWGAFCMRQIPAD